MEGTSSEHVTQLPDQFMAGQVKPGIKDIAQMPLKYC